MIERRTGPKQSSATRKVIGWCVCSYLGGVCLLGSAVLMPCSCVYGKTEITSPVLGLSLRIGGVARNSSLPMRGFSRRQPYLHFRPPEPAPVVAVAASGPSGMADFSITRQTPYQV